MLAKRKSRHLSVRCATRKLRYVYQCLLLLPVLRLTGLSAENHGRPRHAVHPSTSTVEPCRAPRPHEEPNCPPEHHEADQCRNHQDAVIALFFFRGLQEVTSSCFVSSDYQICTALLYSPTCFPSLKSTSLSRHCGLCSWRSP